VPRFLSVTALAGSLVLLAPAPQAWAHPPVEDQIAELSAAIFHDPAIAELYLRRGDLHRATGSWPAALRDYRRSRRLDPQLHAASFRIGQTLLQAGHPRRAAHALVSFLRSHPRHDQALSLHGQALMQMGRHLEAAQQFALAVRARSGPGDPPPDHYLRWSSALEAAGGRHVRAALDALDSGISSLGPLVTLQLAAIDLELKLGRHGAALDRLALVASRSERQESWRARRAEILVKAGRRCEARREYEAALDAIASLPAHHRATPVIRALEDDSRAAIAGLCRDAEGVEAATAAPPRQAGW